MFIIALASIVLGIAGVFITSAQPDGIQKMLRQSGALTGYTAWLAPLADYRLRFLATPWLTKMAAGLTGIILVYVLCALVGRALSASRSAPGREGA